MKSNFNLLLSSALNNAMSKSLLLIIALIYSMPLFSQTVPADPTSVTATPAAVCSGNSSVLKAISTGNTIKWDTVSTGGSSICSSSSGGGFLLYPSTINVYYAESLSPANVPSSGRAAITITINVAPVITSTQPNINTTNDVGQCGRIVIYPSVTVTGTPTPTVAYSNPSGSNFDIGTTTNITTASNTCGSYSLAFDVKVADNEQPTVIAPGAVTVATAAGQTTTTVNLGTPTANDNCGSVTIINNAPTTFSVGTTTVIWTVTDSHGNTASKPQTVTINYTPGATNTPPVIGTVTSSDADNIIAQYTSATLNINWTDDANSGPYKVDVDWRDSSTHTVITGVTTTSVSPTHTYNKTGVFAPIIKVYDGSNASDTLVFKYLVVYVVGNYFTTTEGVFTAPYGSLVSNPTLTTSRRKVEIGVECKPTPNHPGDFNGEMEFEMDGGKFEFETEKIDWSYLSVSACFLATFQGTGYLYPNGHNNNCHGHCHGGCSQGGHQYGILVVQSDKYKNSVNQNKIRIKIWDITAGNAVVFDTQMGADNYSLPTTALSCGTIKVKVPNNCVARPEDATVYSNGVFETALYPNPFTSNFKINVSTVSESPLQVEIFDMMGKMVQTIADAEANSEFVITNELPTGVYFVRIIQDQNSQVVKVIKTN